MVWFTGRALGMEEWAADGTRNAVGTTGFVGPDEGACKWARLGPAPGIRMALGSPLGAWLGTALGELALPALASLASLAARGRGRRAHQQQHSNYKQCAAEHPRQSSDDNTTIKGPQ